MQNNIGKNINTDKYGIKARIFPTIVTVVVPIFIFSHFFVSPELSSIYDGFSKFSLVGDLSISTILMFYLSQYARMIGKNIFEKKYFKGELYMPTTNFLLFSDPEYTKEYKQKIYNKIHIDFGITLSDNEQESKDEMNTRKKIVESMSLIRKQLFENKFLLQHNIEYGAMRNSFGGAVIGVIFSILNIVIFSKFYFNNVAINLSIVTLIIYILLILLSKIIINAYGNAYAKILIREYMGK